MKTVLITGANRGIGLELAKQYLDLKEFQVVATCRTPEAAAELARLAESSRLEVVSLDVNSDASVAALREQLRGRPVDVVINNAGISGGDQQSVESMDYEAWLQVFATNTQAPFRILSALREDLCAASEPRAITLSSQMGSLAGEGTGTFAYRSSKAAVNKVMQVLALEWAGDGIIVCPVHPGWVRTDMGGPHADISVEESASGIIRLVSSLKMEHSGRFWAWDGSELPW